MLESTMPTEEQIRIQPAERTHHEALVALLTAQLVEHSIEVSAERLSSNIAAVFENGHLGALHVAVDGDVPIGVSYLAFTWTLEHGGKAAWLEELYVSPPYRGRGIGQRLLQETLRAARDAGCAAVDLEVESDHRRVEALYQRNEFRPRARSRWFRSPL